MRLELLFLFFDKEANTSTLGSPRGCVRRGNRAASAWGVNVSTQPTGPHDSGLTRLPALRLCDAVSKSQKTKSIKMGAGADKRKRGPAFFCP
jgi:hypothetical protein